MESFDPAPGQMDKAVVVFLNGPPRSGKDTAGKFLSSQFSKSMVVKFAGTLKRGTHIDYGLPVELADNAFEATKDVPQEAFFGRTPREAYIMKSEQQTKPFLGEDHFGRVLRRRMWRYYQQGSRNFFVTDSGFASEAVPVIEAVGEKNCLLMRIHAEQRGCSFSNDSRSYIELPGITTVEIENNEEEPGFLLRSFFAVGLFMNTLV